MGKNTNTFALLICDDQDFYFIDNKVVKIKAENHEQAMNSFLAKYQEELIGLTIATFEFEEYEHQYGYKFSTRKK